MLPEEIEKLPTAIRYGEGLMFDWARMRGYAALRYLQSHASGLSHDSILRFIKACLDSPDVVKEIELPPDPENERLRNELGRIHGIASLGAVPDADRIARVIERCENVVSKIELCTHHKAPEAEQAGCSEKPTYATSSAIVEVPLLDRFNTDLDGIIGSLRLPSSSASTIAVMASQDIPMALDAVATHTGDGWRLGSVSISSIAANPPARVFNIDEMSVLELQERNTGRCTFCHADLGGAKACLIQPGLWESADQDAERPQAVGQCAIAFLCEECYASVDYVIEARKLERPIHDLPGTLRADAEILRDDDDVDENENNTLADRLEFAANELERTRTELREAKR